MSGRFQAGRNTTGRPPEYDRQAGMRQIFGIRQAGRNAAGRRNTASHRNTAGCRNTTKVQAVWSYLHYKRFIEGMTVKKMIS